MHKYLGKFLSGLLLLWALPVWSQTVRDGAVVSEPSGLSRIAHFVGHHVKGTFVDIKHDPLWAAYVIGTVALNSADASSTVYALNKFPTVQEGDPLLPKRPSAGLLVSVTVVATLLETGAFHKLREDYVGKCRKDASDPSSRWNDRNPESCRYAIDVMAMLPWSYHAVIVKDNIHLIRTNGQEN